MSSPCLLHMKFPRCVLERISMKYDRNLGAFGTKERNEIWAEVGRNSGLRQVVSEITSVWVRDSLFSLLASLPEFLYISFTVGPCFPKLFDKVRSRIVFQQKFALSTSDEPHSLCD